MLTEVSVTLGTNRSDPHTGRGTEPV